RCLAPAMFKTARFKVHNPSNHKKAALKYALAQYHLTLRTVLETALSMDDLEGQIIAEREGKKRLDKSALSRLLYTLAPKDWVLAPLRDYLIGDANAMLASHFEKVLKAKNDSNPPSLHRLDPPALAEYLQAADNLANTAVLPIQGDHTAEIEGAREAGQNRLAKKLANIYSSRAERDAVRNLLRSLDVPLPRPIEFTRCEFERGFLLARKGNDIFVFVRMFSKRSRFAKQLLIEDGFVNCRTGEDIGGRKYPGLVLPLELGREYHEQEYLQHGSPQSAKLLIKRDNDGNEEFFVHIAFEFTPNAVVPVTVLGIDRGFAKIGTATVINGDGIAVIKGLELEGTAFRDALKAF